MAASRGSIAKNYGPIQNRDYATTTSQVAIRSSDYNEIGRVREGSMTDKAGLRPSHYPA